MTAGELEQQEYRKRLEVTALRRQVFDQADPRTSQDRLDALLIAETELSHHERRRVTATADAPAESAAEVIRAGVLFDVRHVEGGSGQYSVRGPRTTGLRAQGLLRMAQIPTSVYHLLDKATNPLLTCTVTNLGDKTRRIRITCVVDGYSARAVDTAEIDPKDTVAVDLLPTLFPDRLRDLTELTSATVNILIEDLDGTTELHRTERVPLLARTTAPLAVRDPSTQDWQDLTPFFGAFVTPNAPAIMSFLRHVAEQHPDRSLVGYQTDAAGVRTQVEAVVSALQHVGITYIHSVIAFSPEEGTATQRVRLPRESLGDRQANCIDGTVLVASLLEALSLSPAIVVVPGHAFVGWESSAGSERWSYLETTMIGSHSFAEACEAADDTALRYEQLQELTGDDSRFRRWPLRDLRTTWRITPME